MCVRACVSLCLSSRARARMFTFAFYLHQIFSHSTLGIRFQFSSVLWSIGLFGGTWRTIYQRSFFFRLFCGRSLWAVLAWAGMSNFWRSHTAIQSALKDPPLKKKKTSGGIGLTLGYIWNFLISNQKAVPGVGRLVRGHNSVNQPFHWLPLTTKLSDRKIL